MTCDNCDAHYSTVSPCNCPKGTNGTCEKCGMKSPWCKCDKKDDNK